MATASIADLSARLERLESLIGRVPPPVDPAPDDFGWHWTFPFPFPRPLPWRPPRWEVDPSPVDLSRLSRTQLELSLETIKAQKLRLDALEGMIKTQIKQIK